MSKHAGNDGAGAAKKRRIEQDGDVHLVKILNMVRQRNEIFVHGDDRLSLGAFYRAAKLSAKSAVAPRTMYCS